MHTPVSIYLKVRDLYPQSALLESSDYHADENNLSFIALCPLASIGVNNDTVTENLPGNTPIHTPLSELFTVEKAINGFMNRFQIEGEHADVFGLYGYTTFNAVKYFENIPVKESHDDTNDAPDILYIIYKYVLIFNHFKNKLTLVEALEEGESSTLNQLEAAIENRNYASYNFSVTGPIDSPITDEQHKANIRKGIAHCMRGDVFQIVLSRRFIQPYAGDDFKVYRALRSINPSPYLFYFDFGGFRIFGSSPETHCKIEGTKAYIDSIGSDSFLAGTVSGVPQIRAMQLISEIEPHNRGAYGGCIGFVGFNGTHNQVITIRTFVSRNNELWFQAGGCIVATSQDEHELQEVNNKLEALKKAIDMAASLKN